MKYSGSMFRLKEDTMSGNIAGTVRPIGPPLRRQPVAGMMVKPGTDGKKKKKLVKIKFSNMIPAGSGGKDKSK
jgi:hypothetical protein